MSVWYFPKWSSEEVKKYFPRLKPMTFNSNYFSQFRMPMVVNTKMFAINRQNHFNELLGVLKTCNVVKLNIDHIRNEYQFRWPPNQLERITKEVPKITISLDCLVFTRKNAKDFFQTISKNKAFKVHAECFMGDHYSLTTRDIELMARYDIKITRLSQISLTIPPISEDDLALRKFVDALTKLKHLRSFEFFFEDDISTLIEYFVNVPITELDTDAFDISTKDEFEKVVETLSKMKSLRRFVINFSDYKFLPEDLAKFKGLPVKSIHLEALDLTKENIPEFRRIMLQMNLEKVILFPGEGMNKNEELGIEVNSHGLGGIYKTIGLKSFPCTLKSRFARF